MPNIELKIFFVMLAGVLGMTRKVIEWGVVTWTHTKEILRWLNFKLAQNLNHVSRLRDGSLFQTWNFEMAQNSKQSISLIEFLFWKSEVARSLDTCLRFWVNLKLSHLKISFVCVHDGLHVTTPPSMTFWAISRAPMRMPEKILQDSRSG